MRHVIIGNGPAGVVAAETLRKAAPAHGIVLLGEEAEPPYSRMAIPYLLAGEIDEEGTHLRKDKDHFRQRDIALRTARVASVNATKREVQLDSGDRLPYDRLLIATGAHPNRPPIRGADLPHVLPCWTLADARRILAIARPGAKVVQMGAGFIGCIIMEALAARGVDLTVVEMGNRMVPRMMTEGAGNLIRLWCEKKGIRVLTRSRVEAIEQKGTRMVARLAGGEPIECDLVIAATGVAPNVSFLQGSGIACGEGVLVDHRMQTNVEGVFAAGDVAQSPEFASGRQTVNAIQPAAVEQARIAALNMAGHAVRTPGHLAMNVLDTMGLVASSFGQWSGVPGDEGGQGVEVRDDEAFRYLRLEFRDDVLIGATSLGLTEHVGVLRGLIQGRVKLGDWKRKLLEDPTRVMDAYLACAQGAA